MLRYTITCMKVCLCYTIIYLDVGIRMRMYISILTVGFVRSYVCTYVRSFVHRGYKHATVSIVSMVIVTETEAACTRSRMYFDL